MDDNGQALHRYEGLDRRLQRYGTKLDLVASNRNKARKLLTAVAEWMNRERMSDLECLEGKEIQQVLDQAISAFKHLIKRDDLIYFWK